MRWFFAYVVCVLAVASGAHALISVEFGVRYSNRVALGYNDIDRAGALIQGVIGERFTY